MMLWSHLLVTLILCGLLAQVRRVTKKEWLLAIAFAVGIDIDHLVQFPAYVATHGWTGLTPASMLHWGAAWQGIMHTPWALLLVLPACFVFLSWFPLAFWASHMVLDFVVAKYFVPWGSPLEWAIDAVLLAALGWIAWHDHRQHGAGRPMHAHVWARVATVFTR